MPASVELLHSTMSPAGSSNGSSGGGSLTTSAIEPALGAASVNDHFGGEMGSS